MDLDLTDRVYVAHRGRSRPRPGHRRRLVAEGARVVLSGRSRGDAARRRAGAGRRRRRRWSPTTPTRAPRAAARGGARALGPPRRRPRRVGGPPTGPVTGHQRRAVERRLRVGVPRRGSGWAASSAAALGAGGSLAFVLSVQRALAAAGLAISNGLRPGLAMVAKTLADELGPAGSGSTRCCPGRIGTDRVRELDDATGDPERGARRARSAGIPLRRYGDPEEFGRAATFLLSPAASLRVRRRCCRSTAACCARSEPSAALALVRGADVAAARALGGPLLLALREHLLAPTSRRGGRSPLVVSR